MGATLLALTGVAYLFVAVSYGVARPGMALAFAAYALANLGFWLDLR